jgi:peptide-methionine (S)-S-oxide reductase
MAWFSKMRGSRLVTLSVAALALTLAAAFTPASWAVETAAPVPPATHDPAPMRIGLHSVVLAGGCFWGVQGVFQHVEGVERAVSGYAGGTRASARYDAVSLGRTGHAESVEVTYDPKIVSLGRILRVYFSVAHDPTQLDRQGPDHGTQYRSAIFVADPGQARVARDYIAQLDAARVFRDPIATRIEQLSEFYPAEAYHQDYLFHHPHEPYVAVNDIPKIDNLKRLAPDLYRETPRLVSRR